MYNNEAYQTFCTEINEVVSGRRGWVSLTKYAKKIGINRGQLESIAKARGLAFNPHGRYGYTAYKA